MQNSSQIRLLPRHQCCTIPSTPEIFSFTLVSAILWVFRMFPYIMFLRFVHYAWLINWHRFPRAFQHRCTLFWSIFWYLNISDRNRSFVLRKFKDSPEKLNILISTVHILARLSHEGIYIYVRALKRASHPSQLVTSSLVIGNRILVDYCFVTVNDILIWKFPTLYDCCL